MMKDQKNDTTRQPTHLRWMIQRDASRIARIDLDCFGADNCWSEAEWRRRARCGSRVIMVAEMNRFVIGVMSYRLSKKSLEIERLAVASNFQRTGTGTQMVGNLIGRLNPNRRAILNTCVPERNLAAQLFFRSIAFTCVDIFHDAYVDGDDAYLMQINSIEILDRAKNVLEVVK